MSGPSGSPPLQVSDDLRAEADSVHAFLLTLSPKDWETPTLFMDWTPWDVVAHLHYFDGISLSAAEGAESFAAKRKALLAAVGDGLSTKALQRRDLGHLDPPALLDQWITTCHRLCEKLAGCAPKARLPWFGPDMGVPMFTTARLMETWAHSQAIYDQKGLTPEATDRIQHIVAIGVRTFSWTFVNRKREIPGPPPFVRLTSPRGAIWEYNEPSAEERIEGSALDFCLTVTQVRNVKDTGLQIRGDVARQWMEIAQCFAGAAVDPPAPGVRLGGLGSG